MRIGLITQADHDHCHLQCPGSCQTPKHAFQTPPHPSRWLTNRCICSHQHSPTAHTGGGGGACQQADQCSTTGPWLNFCCPDGFSCQPSGQNYRVWTCQTDVTDRAPVPDDEELLQYPPRQLPADACTCRLRGNNSERVATNCPSPWAHPAGTSQVGRRGG